MEIYIKIIKYKTMSNSQRQQLPIINGTLIFDTDNQRYAVIQNGQWKALATDSIY